MYARLDVGKFLGLDLGFQNQDPVFTMISCQTNTVGGRSDQCDITRGEVILREKFTLLKGTPRTVTV